MDPLDALDQKKLQTAAQLDAANFYQRLEELDEPPDDPLATALPTAAREPTLLKNARALGPRRCALLDLSSPPSQLSQSDWAVSEEELRRRAQRLADLGAKQYPPDDRNARSIELPLVCQAGIVMQVDAALVAEDGAPVECTWIEGGTFKSRVKTTTRACRAEETERVLALGKSPYIVFHKLEDYKRLLYHGSLRAEGYSIVQYTGNTLLITHTHPALPDGLVVAFIPISQSTPLVDSVRTRVTETWTYVDLDDTRRSLRHLKGVDSPLASEARKAAQAKLERSPVATLSRGDLPPGLQRALVIQPCNQVIPGTKTDHVNRISAKAALATPTLSDLLSYPNSSAADRYVSSAAVGSMGEKSVKLVYVMKGARSHDEWMQDISSMTGKDASRSHEIRPKELGRDNIKYRDLAFFRNGAGKDSAMAAHAAQMFSAGRWSGVTCSLYTVDLANKENNINLLSSYATSCTPVPRKDLVAILPSLDPVFTIRISAHASESSSASMHMLRMIDAWKRPATAFDPETVSLLHPAVFNFLKHEAVIAFPAYHQEIVKLLTALPATIGEARLGEGEALELVRQAAASVGEATLASRREESSYQSRAKAAVAKLHNAVDAGMEAVKEGKKRSILGPDQNPRKKFK